MKIAVTHEDGQVFQHFGHTKQFKLYIVEDNKIVDSKVYFSMGAGHGALAGFLKALEADVLICGGIGGGAKTALSDAGIKLYAGVQGDCDTVVSDFIAGKLAFDPNAQCSDHDHHGGVNHDCGNHSCGTHNCGEHSCS